MYTAKFPSAPMYTSKSGFSPIVRSRQMCTILGAYTFPIFGIHFRLCAGAAGMQASENAERRSQRRSEAPRRHATDAAQQETVVETNEVPQEVTGAEQGTEAGRADVALVKKMTVAQLREVLALRGLSTDGVKAALRERFVEFLLTQPEVTMQQIEEYEAARQPSAEPEADLATAEAYEAVNKMTVAQLREGLVTRGLSADGLKAVLKLRLVEDMLTQPEVGRGYQDADRNTL